MNEPQPVPSTNPLAVDLAATRTLMDERDKWYERRWAAQQNALEIAARAQEKFHATVLALNQEAIAKSENAQKEYNMRSNEFRGQLDDQAKTLMPRSESIGLHQATRERLDQLRDESRILVEGLRKELVVLKESSSQFMGQKEGRSDFSVPLLLTITSVVVGLAVFLIQRQLSDRNPAPAPTPTPIVIQVPGPAAVIPVPAPKP